MMTSLSGHVHDFHLVAFLCQRAGPAEQRQTEVHAASARDAHLVSHLSSCHRHAVQADDGHEHTQAVDAAGLAQ